MAEEKKDALATRSANNGLAPAAQGNPWGLGLTSDGMLDIISQGRVLFSSGFFKDIQSASQGIVKAMLGRELGIPTIQAVMNIHIVKDRAVIGADILAQKIRLSGKYDFEVLDFKIDRDPAKGRQPQPDSFIKIKFYKIENKKRAEFLDSNKGVITWTIQDAMDARLGGSKTAAPSFDQDSNWFKWPRNMLFARAIADGRRWYCPDIFESITGGVYTPDELGMPATSAGDLAIDEPEVREEIAASNARAAGRGSTDNGTEKPAEASGGINVTASAEVIPGAKAGAPSGGAARKPDTVKPDTVSTSEKGKVIAWRKKHGWSDDQLRQMLQQVTSYVDVSLDDIGLVVAQLDKTDLARVLEIIEAGPQAFAEMLADKHGKGDKPAVDAGQGKLI